MKFSQFKALVIISLISAIAIFTSCEEDQMGESPTKNNPEANQQPVGVSSNHFLSSENYDRLIIEIQYVAGYKPPQKAIDHLEKFLNDRLNKPNGITFITSEVEAGGHSSYSATTIKTIEDKYRSQYNNGTTLTAYFFFADAGYEQDTDNSKVLGIAYRNTSMAIFQKTIKEYSGGLTQPSETLLTSTVMNHEFGHILGLVNNGTPMESAHQDTSHGKHCDVKGCLMYWTTETNQIVDHLLGMSSPPGLDASCIADLKANGGK